MMMQPHCSASKQTVSPLRSNDAAPLYGATSSDQELTVPVEMHLRLLLKKVNEKWKLRPLRRQRKMKEKEKYGK